MLSRLFRNADCYFEYNALVGQWNLNRRYGVDTDEYTIAISKLLEEMAQDDVTKLMEKTDFVRLYQDVTMLSLTVYTCVSI